MAGDITVRVENASLMYNLSRQREERLKEYVLNVIRGKYFVDPFWALRDISFELSAGDSLGIVGQNGAGKSTLLKLISGVVRPTEGSVYTNGVIAPMVELGISLESTMTVKENVYYLGAMHGFTKKYMDDKYEKIIEFAELGNFASVPAKNLSSGMAARLSFAVATLVNPDILVADEALAVGDMNFVKKCEARMNEIKQKGAIILYVSHEMSQVRALCKKALWLDCGISMMYGPADEVCDAYADFMAGNERVSELVSLA